MFFQLVINFLINANPKIECLLKVIYTSRVMLCKLQMLRTVYNGSASFVVIISNWEFILENPSKFAGTQYIL